MKIGAKLLMELACQVDKFASLNYSKRRTNTSRQVKEFLELQGFKSANIWSHESKNSKNIVYKVPLNGWKNVEKWKQLIGFSNPIKNQKLEEIVEQRLRVLNHS